MTCRDYWTCDRCGAERFGYVRGPYDYGEPGDGTTRPSSWRPVTLKLELRDRYAADVSFAGDLCGECARAVRDAVRAALEKPKPAEAVAPAQP